MCVVSLQLNDPLQKVIILINNHKLPSEQLQHSKTGGEKYLLSKRGTWALCSSSSAVVLSKAILCSAGESGILSLFQFTYLRNTLIFQNSTQSKGLGLFGLWIIIHFLCVQNTKQKHLSKGSGCHLKHFKLIFFQADILFSHSIAGMLSEGERCRVEMLCGFLLRGRGEIGCMRAAGQ